MAASLLIANWKMNKTHIEAEAFLRSYAAEKLPRQVATVICPPFTSLVTLAKELEQWPRDTEARPSLGAQNCAAAASGAFTGEISAPMLQALGCSYVILGHSERRALFAENDSLVAAKLECAMKHELAVVLCIGETQEERDSGLTETVLQRQLRSALNGVTQFSPGKLVLAYEPVWAIGSGRTATAQQIKSVMIMLRSELTTLFGTDLGHTISLLYGGSVNAANIAILPECGADGALVGGASLQPASFADLSRELAKALGNAL